MLAEIELLVTVVPSYLSPSVKSLFPSYSILYHFIKAYTGSRLLKSYFLLVSFDSSNLIVIYCQRIKLKQHILSKLINLGSEPMPLSVTNHIFIHTKLAIKQGRVIYHRRKENYSCGCTTHIRKQVQHKSENLYNHSI